MIDNILGIDLGTSSVKLIYSENGVTVKEREGYDEISPDGEHYIANVLSVKTDSGKKISELSVKLENEKYNLLIYGVTAE